MCFFKGGIYLEKKKIYLFPFFFGNSPFLYLKILMSFEIKKMNLFVVVLKNSKKKGKSVFDNKLCFSIFFFGESKSLSKIFFEVFFGQDSKKLFEIK